MRIRWQMWIGIVCGGEVGEDYVSDMDGGSVRGRGRRGLGVRRLWRDEYAEYESLFNFSVNKLKRNMLSI